MPEKTTVPIGPQHPALKEPANFMLTVEGEEIVGADLTLSYNHRGIERAAQDRDYLQDIYLLERVCGICSHSHSSAFVQGVEELADIEVPARARYIRTLVGELERLHSHLLWLGIGGHEMGFDTLWHYAWRDREIVLDSLEELAGNRVNYAINTIGGVREDLSAEEGERILENLTAVRDRAEYYRESIPEEETVRLRTEDVGVLSNAEARAQCAVGPTARASGLAIDARKEDPYAAYDDLEFEVVTNDRGDLLGRVLVRLDELVQSCDLARQAIEEMPDGDLRGVERPSHTLSNMIEEGEVVSRYEAPRGELIHYLRSDGSPEPARIKIRAPTLANWPSVVEGLTNSYLADAPMIVAGIDPCISCTARIGVELHAGGNGLTGKDGIETLGDLSEYATDWYRRTEDNSEEVD